MPFLRPQYLWQQQSQNRPSERMSKHKLFLPFLFSFDLFSCLRQILRDLKISKNKNFVQFYRPTIHQAVKLYKARRTMSMRQNIPR